MNTYIVTRNNKVLSIVNTREAARQFKKAVKAAFNLSEQDSSVKVVQMKPSKEVR